jgi:hypothetical protein
MRTVLACEQFAVFDDVLEPADLERLQAQFAELRFRPVDPGSAGAAGSARAGGSPWLPGDGRPMTGPAVAAWLDPARAIPDSKLTPFPTATALDPLVQRLLDEAPRLAAWIGTAGTDWGLMTAIAWRYPAGSALSWHTDSTAYSGAFAFYLHPAWDPHWGGELVFADPSARVVRDPRDVAWPAGRGGGEAADDAGIDRAGLAERIAARGIGAHVVPRPNRLVVIAGGHPHRIARVEPAAGDRVRASISGFYVRSQALAAMDRAWRTG